MLIADTLRARRLATVVWIAAGILFMVVIGYGYLEEVEAASGQTGGGFGSKLRPSDITR